MPTIIVFDTSGAMSVPLKSTEAFTPMQLAYNGLHSFLDAVAITSKLEFIALTAFRNSKFEVIAGFTRDIDYLKLKLIDFEGNDDFDVSSAMEGVQTYAVDEWGSGISCNIILVTQDKHILEACRTPLYLIQGNIIICNMGPEIFRSDFIPKLEDYNYKCELYQPEQPVSFMSVQQMLISVAEKYYSSWIGQLVCGHFNSKISLSPSPEPYYSATDFDSSVYKVDSTIEVCGFIELSQVGSPGAVSRHLMLPTPPHPIPALTMELGRDPAYLHGFDRLKGGPGRGGSHFSKQATGSTTSPVSDEDSHEEGQLVNFCVLLHGALKVENMAALCQVGQDWYGVLFSWADSKKKSNLMLSLLEPGSPDAIPWLGDLSRLAINPTPQAEPLPVKTADKRSYTQNCVAWIQQQGLQSDIQKILRHSRKLPEKTQQFYKELNRVRRAAIGLGFMSLIEGLAAVLERECTLLPGTAHPACALQLTHAAGVLREPRASDHKYNIAPLKTSFQSESAGFDGLSSYGD